MNPLSPTTSIWTPTSPAVPLPPPGRDTKFEAAWGARANIPIQTTPPRMTCAPTNGSGAFMQAALSPTRSVQGLTNNDKSNNNIHDLLYSSPGTRSLPRAGNPSFDRFDSPVDGHGSTLPQEVVTPQLEWRSSRTPLNAARNIQIPDAQAARQGSTAIKYGLYRGNSGESFNRWPATTTPVPPRFLGPTSTSSGSSVGSINAGKAPLRSLATPGRSQEVVDWVELIGEKAYSIARTQSSRSEDVSSTQAVATPVSAQTAGLAGYNTSPVSPSSGNFPRSSFSFSSPRDQTYLSIPLPTSPPHSKSSTYLPSIKFTPFSPINSQPQSPEVTSPIGLAALPAISPLASTPIDIAFPNFEARASTDGCSGSARLSAFHLAVDTHLPDSPCVESLTSASHAISPGGTADERLTVDILSLPLPDSPSVSELASPALAAEMTPLLTSGSGMLDIERDVLDKEEHDAESATAHEEDSEEHMHDATGTSSTVGEIKDQPSAPSLRVYCRMCQADPCVEPTATLCGHLFCYKYIR
ncbi:hypothetical protein FPV67DRAFT_1669611 [Lyophyllum atratum]|nr:hypothetical protein FPV67DRAFT_1669611 [Lyophyllum atratum]